MKRILYISLVLCVLLPGAVSLSAQSKAANVHQDPTKPWGETRISPKINVNIKDETKEVHFIQTNNDPYVYTKTYELKNADPYSVRNYLLSAVQALRVNDNDTRVECLRYNDGTGLVLVSAEGYRFNEKQNGGMTIDELVDSLDLPKLKSYSGTPRFMYFPRYVSASSLKTMLDRVGISSTSANEVNLFNANSNEQETGTGVIDVDDELNGLFLYIPNYNLKTAAERLLLYDVPFPEARIKVTVYEIFAENDGKIGADFQSWKNGPGADFFNVGGRWRHGMGADGITPDASKWSSTKYVKFSPKWNSKYLDFLAAEGNAKVLTSGELSIRNRINGIISAKTQIPYFDTSESAGKGGFTSQYNAIMGNMYPTGTPVNNVASSNSNNYMITAYDSGGTIITIDNNFYGRLTIAQVGVSGSLSYILTIPDKKTTFVKDGKDMGPTVSAASIEIYQLIRGSNTDPHWELYSPAWNTSLNGTYDKGPKVKSAFANLSGSGNDYGFKLSITPVITEKATTLSLTVENTSLIGFQSSGAVRTSISSLNTEVMLDNDSGEIIIGGIEKKSIERGVSKVPWLGSILGLGWLFGSEYENTKKSQIVTVLECVTVRPDTAVDSKTAQELKNISDGLKNAGKNDLEDPNYGFNQFILDKNKKKLEPLP
ncbi:MAG: hypothetical protein A2017_04905 [Lentisphaerae bacterium GWF2_44_16]|nr:MAG: hypothetical protein A2017_04905 [Lentisphaerae bacterium GWF2_44_16]